MDSDFISRNGEYLDDGVYATFDGYHVWVHTERDGVWQSIALEPSTFDALINYRKKVYEKATEAALEQRDLP
jgi:hypothetical protein